MNRFHKPGSEKRSVVILRPDEYEDWLTAKSPDEARSFISLYPAGSMHAAADPAPPRKTRTVKTS